MGNQTDEIMDTSEKFNLFWLSIFGLITLSKKNVFLIMLSLIVASFSPIFFLNFISWCMVFKFFAVTRSIFQLSLKWLDLLQEKSTLKIKTNFSQKFANKVIC